jgi:thiol:disulfide interchange protein
MSPGQTRYRFSRVGKACVLLWSLVAFACRSGNTPSGGASKPVGVKAASRSAPVFIRAPSGGQPVAPFVAAELARGRSQGHGVLVYVGATWCEPCQGFHKAVLAGEFDELLAGVRLLEFDLDADRDVLEAAGYHSEHIPLFALPKADGTASEQRIEGSIKGPEAVRANLMPRLRAFLSGQAAAG